MNDFSKFFKLKKESDLSEKYNSTVSGYSSRYLLKDTHIFEVSYITNTNSILYNRPISLFRLDEEDLQYLMKKYSYKIEEERLEKIANINKEYE